MNKSSISEQLKHDYPYYKIYLDAGNRMVVADNHKMSLLNSTSALETMNIFSQSGRSFYQAITQLLYSNYGVLPKKGSYASTLIILQEDLKKYKIQKLAKEWGIGFLEDNEDILALEVDDGIERDLLLEGSEMYEELDELSGNEELEEWAKLEEIDFNSEITYLEKGLEFASEMEEVELKDSAIKSELVDSEIVELEVETGIKSKKLKNIIRKIFWKGL
ncbi:MAG: hypothetical protein KAQ93_07970 [Spirochaetales bacterium]|nr:hypothetical protein [Spirochaetales bacterium]